MLVYTYIYIYIYIYIHTYTVLLDGAEARGADEVGRLEEVAEGELLALGLEQEAAPLVERRGAEAAHDDHDEQHLRRVGRPLRLDGGEPERGVVADDAVRDVADHGGQVGLVDVAPLHLQLHGLAVAVVRHGQGRRGEDEAGDEAADGRGDGQRRAEGVDGLEEGELQEVGGQGGLEEVEHHGRGHVVDSLHEPLTITITITITVTITVTITITITVTITITIIITITINSMIRGASCASRARG